MTRRLAWAMFMTVLALLLVGGVTGFLLTRAVLLGDLDESLVRRASALPELEHPADLALGAEPSEPIRDYLITNEIGQTLRQKPGQPPVPEAQEPTLISANFATLPDGQRVRTVVIRALAKPTSPGAHSAVVTVAVRASAAGFDRVMDRLAELLGLVVLIGALLAAAAAVFVSRAALRPLHVAAEVLGTINERELDRRISADALPEELRPMADRLNEMLARLEEAFSRRKQFLADASHELRTPVAALVTTLEVALRRERDSDAYRQTIERSLGDARLLRRLVEMLMEQVRSETLARNETAQEIDAAALLDECADMAETLTVGRNIRVIRQFPSQLRILVAPQRLRSVVMNLLSNGVEYNREGGTLTLACCENENGIELKVSDTGQGIAPDQLTHIFEPFFRGDSSHHERDHLGLGLFLVQSHIRAMGGNCKVESELGVGTTFRISLPLSVAVASS